MDKEHQLKKALVEKELYEHYEKIVEGMLKWCIYDQPEDITVMTSAFKINKQEIALKAFSNVLEKWNENT